MSGKLKEVRIRIGSVKSTQQITSAMKMVAAAKLRKAQQAITEMRPYSTKLNSMLQNIVSNSDGNIDVSYGKEREINSACVVVLTSDKGLCGAFNTNIIKAARQTIDEKLDDVRKAGNLTIVCSGKKGYDFFRKNYSDCKIVDTYLNYMAKPAFINIEEAASHVMEGFDDGTYDVVYASYARFRNPAVQYPECVQFLPVPTVEKEEEESAHRADFIFEPNKTELLNHLFPTILKTQLFSYYLDTAASEHGARMTAMNSATENAEELLKDLKIAYNKARQEAITSEISEIVGGAAALEGA